MNKAIFLDRDGVINKELGDYVYNLNEFELLSHAFKVIKWANEQGYLVVVVTNQSGIDKKLYTHEQLNEIHKYMLHQMQAHNCKIDAVYYCAHHPTVQACICRKPDSVLVEKAIYAYNIDATKSIFVGDRERDILAGAKAGVKGLLISSNEDYVSQMIDALNN